MLTSLEIPEPEPVVVLVVEETLSLQRALWMEGNLARCGAGEGEGRGEKKGKGKGQWYEKVEFASI